ncbi:MAG TPA: HU family DNA-binding protein [Desulfovibrio sp.]|nr:HU family DNA-binding protein [Desulfovibrio sp.]
MTKAELIENIKAKLADNPNTKHIHEKTIIAAVLDALGTVTGTALASGGEVPLPGIGKLKGKPRAARRGRNPRTGAAIDIAAHMGVKFEPGKALVDALKGVAA